MRALHLDVDRDVHEHPLRRIGAVDTPLHVEGVPRRELVVGDVVRVFVHARGLLRGGHASGRRQRPASLRGVASEPGRRATRSVLVAIRVHEPPDEVPCRLIHLQPREELDLHADRLLHVREEEVRTRGETRRRRASELHVVAEGQPLPDDVVVAAPVGEPRLEEHRELLRHGEGLLRRDQEAPPVRALLHGPAHRLVRRLPVEVDERRELRLGIGVLVPELPLGVDVHVDEEAHDLQLHGAEHHRLVELHDERHLPVGEDAFVGVRDDRVRDAVVGLAAAPGDPQHGRGSEGETAREPRRRECHFRLPGHRACSHQKKAVTRPWTIPLRTASPCLFWSASPGKRRAPSRSKLT